MNLPPFFKHFSLSLLIFLLSADFAISQHVLKGQILDSISTEPLPFAHVIYDQASLQGVTSDIHGHFVIRSSTPITKLEVRYLGYKSREMTITAPQEAMRILLAPANMELNEVVIMGDRYPVETLMKKVIANRKSNDPERSRSFSYQSYNKINCGMHLSQSVKSRTDSAALRLKAQDEQAGILVMESVSERRFIFPDHDEETILGTKVSGFRNPLFASLARDFQPFSFYQEIITVLDKNYINPIAGGSLRRYEYAAQDTLFQAQDTVYVILFRPKKGKTFDGLTGLLYINTNKFAVQNVIARPADPGKLEIEIEQKYVLLDEEQWFPAQLNFELLIKDYPGQGIGIKLQGESFIQDVNLNPGLRKKDFAIENIKMADSAGMKSLDYWQRMRVDSLSQREKNTYQFADSIGEELNFDQLASQIGKLNMGKLQLKYADLLVDKLYVFNEFEGHRIGLGLSSNESLSQKFTIGGYAAYGFRDRGLKYGSKIDLQLFEKQELSLSFKLSDDVSEPGQSLFESNRGLTNIRSYQASRMDRLIMAQAELKFRAMRFGNISLQARHFSREALYDYRFTKQNGESLAGAFSQTEVELGFRYAFRERIAESFGQQVSLGSKYPILGFRYAAGLPELPGSSFAYHKVEGQLSWQLVSKGLGNTRMMLRAGWMQGEAPASLLFHGAGNFSKSAFLYAENYFQTMTPYEFLSDQYAQFFIYQDLGNKLFSTPLFSPRLSLAQGVAIGTLARPEAQEEITFQTMEKGFFESGLIVRQLIRINYLNLGYLGLGGGVFYRYGAYAQADVVQNLVFKVNVSFSSD